MRRGLEKRADELQGLDVASLLMTDEAEQMPGHQSGRARQLECRAACARHRRVARAPARPAPARSGPVGAVARPRQLRWRSWSSRSAAGDANQFVAQPFERGRPSYRPHPGGRSAWSDTRGYPSDQQPAPVGRIRDQQRHPFAHGAGEMRDGGIDATTKSSMAMTAAVSEKSLNCWPSWRMPCLAGTGLCSADVLLDADKVISATDSTPARRSRAASDCGRSDANCCRPSKCRRAAAIVGETIPPIGELSVIGQMEGTLSRDGDKFGAERPRQIEQWTIKIELGYHFALGDDLRNARHGRDDALERRLHADHHSRAKLGTRGA